MKKINLLLSILLVAGIIKAQSPLPKGKMQLNAGAGFSSWGLPVYVGVDYAIHKDVTLGAEGSFRAYRDNWQGRSYGHSVIGISANGNYHFNSLLKIPTKFDFYAGANVGFYIWNSPSDYGGSNVSGLGFGGQVGGRYYFNERIGINLEFGGGNAFSNGKIGVSLKL